MMMGSREAVVDYMTPLGLPIMMAHRPSLRPRALGARARAAGLEPGLLSPRRRDRASASTAPRPAATRSRNMRRQVAKQLRRPVDDARRRSSALVPPCAVGLPDEVGPHAVGRAGRSITDGRRRRSRRCRRNGDALKPYVDAERFEKTAAFLAIQQHEAQWWRDACIAYFQTFSKRPLPAGVPAPAHPLDYYEALDFPYAPGADQPRRRWISG